MGYNANGGNALAKVRAVRLARQSLSAEILSRRPYRGCASRDQRRATPLTATSLFLSAAGNGMLELGNTSTPMETSGLNINLAVHF